MTAAGVLLVAMLSVAGIGFADSWCMAEERSGGELTVRQAQQILATPGVSDADRRRALHRMSAAMRDCLARMNRAATDHPKLAELVREYFDAYRRDMGQ